MRPRRESVQATDPVRARQGIADRLILRAPVLLLVLPKHVRFWVKLRLGPARASIVCSRGQARRVLTQTLHAWAHQLKDMRQ